MRRAPYELVLESQVPDARPRYHFSTADGVCSKHSFRTSELLLVEALWERDLGTVLSVQANYGVVGTVLANRAAAVHLSESSARAAHLCEHNAIRNDVDVSVSLDANIAARDDTYDTVAYAPKPYTPLSVGKQRIACSLAALRPGGTLYVVASKQTGRTRYEECLREITPHVEILSERNGDVLFSATRPQSFEPPTYVSPREIRTRINGTELSLYTVPGLFSASKLDTGTRLLLETASIDEGQRVLDLCCGYGAIGTYAAHVADCDVWLSDDDRIATWCAASSLRASGVDGTIVTADCTEGIADRTFECILCNPPTHAGSHVLSELFAGMYDVLAPDRNATIVHHNELDLRRYCSQFSTIETLRMGTEHVILSLTS